MWWNDDSVNEENAGEAERSLQEPVVFRGTAFGHYPVLRLACRAATKRSPGPLAPLGLAFPDCSKELLCWFGADDRGNWIHERVTRLFGRQDVGDT